MLRATCWVILVFFTSLPVWASLNSIEGVRVAPEPANTRIVFDLKKEPTFTYFRLQNPNRIVIDLVDTNDDTALKLDGESGSLVKKVRYSKPKNKSSARIVVELNRQAEPNLFTVAPSKDAGHRLVLDLADSAPDFTNITASKPVYDRDRDIIIAIDAGHGGNDPGSIGPAGTYEKHITMRIAQKLKALIDKEDGLKAVMVRTGDYYISPNNRPEIARQKKADLLISIHADAFTEPEPRGASVWVLSKGRASSELGRWMERTERHSELLGGAADVITDKTSERYLAATILGMAMDHSIASSHKLSNYVIADMKQVTKLHKKSPQHASLAVLTAPDIPSILVEVGFISNPQEEKNLNWQKHRENLAEAMLSSVKRYFSQTPPDGTLWASRLADKRTHKVRNGESLSLLAQRYNVKVSSIKAANNLNSDVVRIGQVLTIPRS